MYKDNVAAAKDRLSVERALKGFAAVATAAAVTALSPLVIFGVINALTGGQSLGTNVAASWTGDTTPQNPHAELNFVAISGTENIVDVSIGIIPWLTLALAVALWQGGVVRLLATALGWRPSVHQTSTGNAFKDLGIRHRAKIWLTLERLNQALFLRVPRRRRKEILEELRANVVESAVVSGPDEALRQLGSVRSLTREYLSAERHSLDWAGGIAAGLTALIAVWIIALFGSAAFIEGWKAAGGVESVTRSLGLFTVRASENSFSTEVHGFFSVLLPFIAFVTALRPWRLLHR